MDTDFVKAFLGFTVTDRIVEILGVVRVDGESGSFPHIPAFRDLLFGDPFLDPFCTIEHLFGEFVGELVLGQNGMHFHFVDPGFSQDLPDLAERARRFRGPIRDLRDGLLTVLPLTDVLQGNVDVDVHLLAVWDQESEFLGDLEGSHEGASGPFQYLHDLSFRVLVLALRVQVDLDAVLIQGGVQVLGSDVDVLFEVLRDHVGRSLLRHVHLSGHIGDPASVFVARPPRFLDLIVLDELVQDLPERLPLFVAPQSQPRSELLGVEDLVRLGA